MIWMGLQESSGGFWINCMRICISGPAIMGHTWRVSWNIMLNICGNRGRSKMPDKSLKKIQKELDKFPGFVVAVLLPDKKDGKDRYAAGAKGTLTDILLMLHKIHRGLMEEQDA